MGVLDELSSNMNLCDSLKDPRYCSFIKSMHEPVSCITDRPYSQITAIVEKYMKDHPEKWNYDMASIVWTAISEACKKNNP